MVRMDRPSESASTSTDEPASAALRDVAAVAQRMVEHFADYAAPAEADLTRLTHTVTECARTGVPLEAIHHAIHAGYRTGLHRCATTTSPEDVENLTAGLKLVISVLNVINSTASLVYLTELRSVLCERRGAATTLVAALLGGRSTSTMARESGVTLAESYIVVALSFPPRPVESIGSGDTSGAAQSAASLVRDGLAAYGAAGVLSLLGAGGGTVLIPSSAMADDRLDDLVKQLSATAEVDVTATSVQATVLEIPDAAEHAHELLNLVRQVDSTPGLYRFGDFALEYQLTRPGPARRYLATLLDPLDSHPDLIETLRIHLANELNRRRTGRQLHVHANTVDYRMHRIKELTGIDPVLPSGMWYLRSALIARGSERARGR